MIFTYSLFIGLCSASSNMTGYSHSYHSIKLIHCSAPKRDVLSDKMVSWVLTRSLYFMLCQSYLLSTVINFLDKDKWWWLIFLFHALPVFYIKYCYKLSIQRQMVVTHIFLFYALPVFFIKYCHKLCIQRQTVVRWKHVSYLLYEKYLKHNSFIPAPHSCFIELNFKTLLCNWRGSP